MEIQWAIIINVIIGKYADADHTYRFCSTALQHNCFCPSFAFCSHMWHDIWWLFSQFLVHEQCFDVLYLYLMEYIYAIYIIIYLAYLIEMNICQTESLRVIEPILHYEMKCSASNLSWLFFEFRFMCHQIVYKTINILDELWNYLDTNIQDVANRNRW